MPVHRCQWQVWLEFCALCRNFKENRDVGHETDSQSLATDWPPPRDDRQQC